MTQRWSVFAGDQFFGVYEAPTRESAIERVSADMGYCSAHHAAAVLDIPLATYLKNFRVFEVRDYSSLGDDEVSS